MNKRNLLYYLFALFIIAIFLWWWILLFQKNENVYYEKLALYDLIIDIDDSETTKLLYNQEVARLNTQHKRQKLMITGEGLTFLILLLLGIIRLTRYFQKEIALVRQQSNFLLSITHELRSPLASALLNIQTMQKRPNLDQDKQQALLGSSNSELSRLAALVEKLLFTARMEAGKITLEEQEVNLSSLYGKLFGVYKETHDDRYTITGTFDDDIIVKGDSVLLASIFTNLADNAVKYCQPGGNIDFGLEGIEGVGRLTVANDGPVIPANEKERIWGKFYRIGDEHTRSSIGAGLGLYIVRRLVEMHHGRVAIRDKTKGSGVIFQIELPNIMT